MDEAAHQAGVDPVQFRLSLLDGAGRTRRVGAELRGRRSSTSGSSRLPKLRKAGWGNTMPKDVGLGIASTFGQERTMPTWIACAARLRVDRTNGHVAVEKLTIVIDAGTIIHPDSAAAREGGRDLVGSLDVSV